MDRNIVSENSRLTSLKEYREEFQNLILILNSDNHETRLNSRRALKNLVSRIQEEESDFFEIISVPSLDIFDQPVNDTLDYPFPKVILDDISLYFEACLDEPEKKIEIVAPVVVEPITVISEPVAAISEDVTSNPVVQDITLNIEKAQQELLELHRKVLDLLGKFPADFRELYMRGLQIEDFTKSKLAKAVNDLEFLNRVHSKYRYFIQFTVLFNNQTVSLDSKISQYESYIVNRIEELSNLLQGLRVEFFKVVFEYFREISQPQGVDLETYTSFFTRSLSCKNGYNRLFSEILDLVRVAKIFKFELDSQFSSPQELDIVAVADFLNAYCEAVLNIPYPSSFSNIRNSNSVPESVYPLLNSELKKIPDIKKIVTLFIRVDDYDSHSEYMQKLAKVISQLGRK